MWFPAPRIDPLRRLAETLLIAAIGGGLAGLTGVPAGWLSGSMLFVAAAAVIGRPMFVPGSLARGLFALMGMSLGSVVTPQTVHGMGAYPVSIAVLAAAMLGIMAATAFYLHLVHHWDPLSALFAASPGALSQVMVLSLESGADVRGVAIVQTVRVFILTLGLPGGMALFGWSGSPPVLPTGAPFGTAALELLVLIGCSALGAFIFERLRFPGGLIFGAMLPSAILHGTGWIQVRLPWWALCTLMVALGATSGARFANSSLRVLMGLFGAAVGSFAIAISVALGCALAASWLLSLRAADLVVAYAPGSLDAMMLLALALGLDPVFVGAHHVGRFILVSACLPLVVRLFGRSGRRQVAAAPQPERPPVKE
jgi:membrane AbrB-like protein